jgi:uncharacterized protein (DUF934 family)
MQLVSPAAALPASALTFANDDDVLAHADDVGRASLIVLQFPKWTDGRAYSQAVLLRGRLRYAGEIRAVGDVVVDMLPLLRRCGFDAAQLRADQDPATADRTLGFFPRGHYQGDAAGGKPRFAGAGA